MATGQLEIVEEIEDNRHTGIEQEKDEEESNRSERVTKNPWDPTLIRVDPKIYSLKQLLEMIESSEIDLAPDFQRNSVWKPIQKCRLIESIFLRIPLPAFYFSSSDDGLLQVVDGVQRLSTIRDFAGLGSNSNGFPLQGLEYLQAEVGGKRFQDLQGTPWIRRLNSTQVFANVIDPQTPPKVKFDIFKRINTGGSPLNAQEIRHCISKQRSRDFLKKLTQSEAFVRATSGTFRQNVRMVDREVVLRFCAFKKLENIKEYASYETMDEFLTDVNSKIDHVYTNEQLAELECDFERAMNNAWNIFREHTFRKWADNDETVYPFNRALFEAWSVVLSNYEWEQLESKHQEIVLYARSLMTESDFLAAISAATGDARKVETRFTTVRDLLRVLVDAN